MLCRTLLSLVTLGVIFQTGPSFQQKAQALTVTNTEYAQKLFLRISGVSLRRSDPRLAEMTAHIEAGEFEDAARIAMESEEFYSVTLRNLSAPMSARDESPLTVFNDFQATFLGAVRDNLDARTLLTGDYRYEAYDDLGLPPATLDSNLHYEELAARSVGLKRNLRKVSPQWFELPVAAGLLTSRTWGEQHLSAGTNRRAVEFTFKQFLCREMPEVRDRGLPLSRIRRDVDRTPGGDADVFNNECRTCHAVLDGLTGAFARLDFKDDRIVHTGNLFVAAKMNQNSHVYPEGFRVLDDSWVNHATRNHNEQIGWTGQLKGSGPRAFGEMVANSRGFSQCMVQRAFRAVCPKQDLSQPLLNELTDRFESEEYRLNDMFAFVSSHPSCVRRPDAALR